MIPKTLAQRRRPPPDIPERTRPDAPSAQATVVGASTAGAALPRLLVTAGPRTGAEFALAESRTTIGRASANAVIIADLSVSRRHVHLQQGRRGWLVLDQGSGNGTRVNGCRVRRKALRHGDEIELGDTRLRFLEPGGVLSWGEVRSPASGRHIRAAALLAIAIVGAAVAVRQGRVREASEAEARAAALRARAQAAFAEGAALAERGKWGPARDRLRIAAELWPEDPEIARALQSALRLEEDPSERREVPLPAGGAVDGAGKAR